MNLEVLLDALIKFHRWCAILEFSLVGEFKNVWEKMTYEERLSMYLTFNHN